MRTGELLADQLCRTREWTLRLIGDLHGSDWSWQPAAGLQHALWICGHLAHAQEALILKRCLGQSSVLPPDFAAHFGIGGPIKSAAEHAWPSPEEVRRRMDEVQTVVEKAVAGMSDAVLREPALAGDGSKHPHYDDKLGAVSHASRHEAFHAGQLSMIRRLLGKPFLR
jgi:hypothetical protein